MTPRTWLNWLTISSLFFLVACATTQKPSNKSSYSDATEKTFEEIERSRVLDYYRQLRESGSSRKSTTRPTTIRPKQYNSQQRRPVVKATPKPLSKEQQEAIEREVSQNLSFFCMLNRKDSRFKDEAECTAYAQNVLYECKKRLGDELSKKLIRCVKSELKL